MEIVNLNTPYTFLPSFSNDTSTVFETIRYEDGNFFYLEYHQQRVEKTLKQLYHQENAFDLKKILKKEKFKKNGKYRVKVIYSKEGVQSIEFFPYKAKKIQKIALVEVGDFEYRFKYLDRKFFHAMYEEFRGIDEFLLLKNGYISDFTIGNVALYDNKWMSVNDFLLEGTTLKRFLDKKVLELKKVHFSNLPKYSKIALLNAMVDFTIIKG